MASEPVSPEDYGLRLHQALRSAQDAGWRAAIQKIRAPFLARLNTAPLQRGTTPTRVLVVLNRGSDAPGPSRVRFAARFPVRRWGYPKPVTVRDEHGTVTPSRLVRSEMVSDSALLPGLAWWDMELEFVAEPIASGWRSYLSEFGECAESRADDALYWEVDAPPLLMLPVWETDCHEGDLPATGFWETGDPDIMNPK